MVDQTSRTQCSDVPDIGVGWAAAKYGYLSQVAPLRVHAYRGCYIHRSNVCQGREQLCCNRCEGGHRIVGVTKGLPVCRATSFIDLAGNGVSFKVWLQMLMGCAADDSRTNWNDVLTAENCSPEGRHTFTTRLGIVKYQALSSRQGYGAILEQKLQLWYCMNSCPGSEDDMVVDPRVYELRG
mmetsp:Transcript_13535/g.39384  ORF Transcript_13535/g.39384 Transcript_13535/m.39384 type:complete len:182 (+) Transcript_13535:352-897(+)